MRSGWVVVILTVLAGAVVLGVLLAKSDLINPRTSAALARQMDVETDALIAQNAYDQRVREAQLRDLEERLQMERQALEERLQMEQQALKEKLALERKLMERDYSRKAALREDLATLGASVVVVLSTVLMASVAIRLLSDSIATVLRARAAQATQRDVREPVPLSPELRKAA